LFVPEVKCYLSHLISNTFANFYENVRDMNYAILSVTVAMSSL